MPVDAARHVCSSEIDESLLRELEAGVDIYGVSKLLGHSDVRIAQKVSAPLCGKFLASEASKLGSYLAPAYSRHLYYRLKAIQL